MRRIVGRIAGVWLQLLLLGVLGACGGGGSGTPGPGVSPTPRSTPTAAASAPAVPVPANGAYLGAWVNPTGASHPTPADIESYTQALESAIGRKLSLHMHYYGWGTGNTPSFPDAAMQSDLAAGRTPVVTWACGDANAAVANGADDGLLASTASAIKQFRAPMFVRWYWEMNLAPGTNNQDCIGTQGAAGYVAAWQHIYSVFKAQGVTNVSWLWNPAGAAADPDPAAYYPGDAYVDWIGFDGYDKAGANNFDPVFSNFYGEFHSHGKPLLIAETGECPAEQANYISSAQSAIGGNGTVTPLFPLVRGFMYFDAPGHYRNCTWNLGAAGTAAFGAMGADPYFQPVP